MRRIDSIFNERGWKYVTLYAENEHDMGELARPMLISLDKEIYHLSTIPVDNHEDITYYMNDLKLRMQKYLEGNYSFVEDGAGNRIERGYEVWLKGDDDY